MRTDGVGVVDGERTPWYLEEAGVDAVGQRNVRDRAHIACNVTSPITPSTRSSVM
jgi:hypothetical protein